MIGKDKIEAMIASASGELPHTQSETWRMGNGGSLVFSPSQAAEYKGSQVPIENNPPIDKMPSESWSDREYVDLQLVRSPIDMVLFCPSCGKQHIDAPEECPDEGCQHYGTPHGHNDDWTNPPHRSHLCHQCGHIWRPADVATNGVKAIKTKGQSDSPTCNGNLQSKAFALKEWFDKTYWVQERSYTFSVRTLGMHRADVMRNEIEFLRKKVNDR